MNNFLIELLLFALALSVSYLLSLKARRAAIAELIDGATLNGYYHNQAGWIMIILSGLAFIATALVYYTVIDFFGERRAHE